MKRKEWKFWEKNFMAVVGMLIFAAGINFFIVPARLYNGGVMGISQVIRTLLVDHFSVLQGSRDIAGMINLVLNMPLFFLAYLTIGKNFFARTVICVLSQTFFLSILPIPGAPMVEDTLTASVIGGIMTGAGIGIALQSGGSSGGMDIVGMYFAKRYKNFSVGKVSLIVNAFVYGACAIMFGISTAIYSVIYSVVSTLMTDKAHTQNINTKVLIFTKENPEKILEYIVREFKRDATWWEAKGGYTGSRTYVVVTALSKYECVHLRRELKMIDEHAFVVEEDGIGIVGRYEKHL